MASTAVLLGTTAVAVADAGAGVPGTSSTVIVEVVPAVTVAVVNCTCGMVIAVLMTDVVLEEEIVLPADTQGTVTVVW